MQIKRPNIKKTFLVIAKVVGVLCVVFLLYIGYGFLTVFYDLPGSEWKKYNSAYFVNGKAPSLKGRTVTIGPVEVGKGVRGVAEFGSHRGKIEASLGKPLIVSADYRGRGLIEDEADFGSLYERLYGWLVFNDEDTLYQMRFAFNDIKYGMKGHLIVILKCETESTILTERTTPAQFQNTTLYRRHFRHNTDQKDMLADNQRFWLKFQDGYLHEVTIY